jgi:hypothetical protein
VRPASHCEWVRLSKFRLLSAKIYTYIHGIASQQIGGLGRFGRSFATYSAGTSHDGSMERARDYWHFVEPVSPWFLLYLVLDLLTALTEVTLAKFVATWRSRTAGSASRCGRRCRENVLLPQGLHDFEPE